MAEQGGQAIQFGRRRRDAVSVQGRPDVAFPATGQDHPPACAALAQLLEVVQRTALLVTSQLRLGDRRGQQVIALDTTSQNEQVLTLGVGDAVLGVVRPSDNSAP